MMPSFLLTWNPNNWSWPNLHEDYSTVQSEGFVETRWSCGRTMKIRSSDRVFLYRQGSDPRGVIASGYVISEKPFREEHFSDPSRKALYIKLRFDVLLLSQPGEILEYSKLSSPLLSKVNWKTQSSGISIEAHAAEELETLWINHLAQKGYSPMRLSEEITTPEQFWEGALRKIMVNVYERNPIARKRCITHFGTSCQVCGFDFVKKYGVRGEAFIHVHHIRQLSEICKGYKVDPILDLIPVCPNCHAMLHKTTKPCSIEELKKILASIV